MHLSNGKFIEEIYFDSCIRGALFSVQDVLGRGVDMNTHFTQPDTQPQWWTALHLAAANGQDEVVKLLVEAGMDVNLETSAGNSPLRFAAMYGHLSTCKLLIDLGADMNLKRFDGKAGKEWIIEKRNEESWGREYKSGCPDKFAQNTSDQHQEIIDFLGDSLNWVFLHAEKN